MQSLEDRLAGKPLVTLPTVTIDGSSDPLKPGGTVHHARMFAGPHEHRVVDAGHNLPQQAPHAFADAVIRVQEWLT
jgi:pimeloyl-ACP methyl ester carboxylesterase